MKKMLSIRCAPRIVFGMIIACVTNVPSYANTIFNGETVTAVGTYGNGAAYIFVSTPINAPGCAANANRIDIPASNPYIHQIMAVAMTALASNALVYGAVNGCDPNTGNPTLDQSYNSYLYVQ
jgi:hypothetical protein